MKIDGIEFNEKQVQALIEKGLLSFGAKHDVSSTTPSAQALHGPFPGNNSQFGVFTSPGVRPGMYNATARVETVGRVIPMLKSEFYNEIIEIMTGVTAGSGNNDVSSCATAPKAGDLKTCQQTYSFGVIHIGTRVDDITQIGMKKNRADVPREFYNQAKIDNPWLPDIPGIEGMSTSTSRLRNAVYTVGVELERNVSPVHFVGLAGTENNTYRGVARQWNGLDNLIKTGYTDAVTTLACSRADSQVASFNAPVDSTDALGRDIIEAVTDTYFGAQALAENLGMAGVAWALVMRPDQFKAVTEKWACSYSTYRCTDGAAGEPLNRDAVTVYNDRVNMFNGRYLLIEGQQVPVILDHTIARDVLGNNYYKADIYGVALSWAGRPLLFGEYFDMGNSEAEEFANAFGITADETAVINDGMYRVFKRVTKGCYEYDFFARPRLILDAPFLSFRVDDVFYNSYYRQVDPIPGTSHHYDGGVSYRL